MRHQRWVRCALLSTTAVILLAGASTPAAAHEDGVLTLASRRLTAGDSVRIVGDRFGRRATLSLALVGIDGRVALGEVRADTAGGFVRNVVIPRDVQPGAFRLVAIAGDGDEVATLDVTVAPARTAPVAADEDSAHESEPTAEPLVLVRARSPMVTGGAVAAVILALLVGGALLRRPPSAF